MSKLQIVKTFMKPCVDNAVKLVTNPSNTTKELAGELAGTAKMVNVTKLADDIVLLTGEALEGIGKHKKFISDDLYIKLENAIINKNFKLKELISEHYSKLNECKTLADVAKFYPDIKIPNITPKTILTDMISEHISPTKMAELQDFAKKGTADKIDEFLESIISPQLKNSEKFADIKPLLAEVKDDIIANKFIAGGTNYTPKPIGSGKGLNTVAGLYGDNFDEIVLEMLKRHYLKGENVSEIVVESTKGVKLTPMLLRKQGYELPTIDRFFKKTIDSIEAKASKLLPANSVTREEIFSESVKNAWKAGNLRNEWRGIAKHWKILENVWMKNSGQMKGFYDTDKLIDSYLLNKYVSGARDVVNPNPFAKYMDSLPFDQKKKNALEMLYLLARPKAMSGRGGVIDTAGFKEFKAKFDIEGMTKSIEELEQHYQKAFLKKFWSDTNRRNTFSEALKEEYKKLGRDFELTDDLLKQVSDEMFF